MTRELNKYLEKLKSAQHEHAKSSLTRPKDKTAFGYGQASGQLLGLYLAEQLLTETIEELSND